MPATLKCCFLPPFAIYTTYRQAIKFYIDGINPKTCTYYRLFKYLCVFLNWNDRLTVDQALRLMPSCGANQIELWQSHSFSSLYWIIVAKLPLIANLIVRICICTSLFTSRQLLADAKNIIWIHSDLLTTFVTQIMSIYISLKYQHFGRIFFNPFKPKSSNACWCNFVRYGVAWNGLSAIISISMWFSLTICLFSVQKMKITLWLYELPSDIWDD